MRTEDLQFVEPPMSMPGMLVPVAVAVELDIGLLMVLVAMAVAADVVVMSIARVMALCEDLKGEAVRV